jgi:hypothetical protein
MSQARPGVLNLWHWHLDGSPPVPNTAWRSSQLASLAGTIVTSGVIAVSVMWTYSRNETLAPRGDELVKVERGSIPRRSARCAVAWTAT